MNPIKTFVVDDIYLFFVTAFGAAPGAVYLSQLSDAASVNFSTLDFIKVFTQKSEFLSVYPADEADAVFADRFIRSVVKTSVGEAEIQIAKQQVIEAFGAGLSKADVIFNVIGNLSDRISDPSNAFFPVAQLFKNQVQVARYYSQAEAEGGLGKGGTNLQELQAALREVKHTSDVSTPAKMRALVEAGIQAANPGDDFSPGTTSGSPLGLGRLAVGGQVQGNIEVAGDEDGFAIDLVAGTTYLFDLSSRLSGGGTLGDGQSAEAALFLIDSEGRPIGFEINGGPNGDPRISFKPTTSGTYYLKAAGAEQTDLGTYTLKAALGGPDDFASGSRSFTSSYSEVEIVGSSACNDTAIFG